ncbi:MAG: copper oxidase [Acidobacteriota bacterium]|nr:copper oxidase [Acidobacteriota bacterium]
MASAGVATASRALAQPQSTSHNHESGSLTGGRSRRGGGIVPFETPDVARLPWTMEGGAKVFHIVAEPVRTEFLPGRAVDGWGFNGSIPGPTVEVNQGDRVRFVVENRLPEVFSMHWHGLEVPIGMDGVPGISQDPIPPGGKFIYEFTLHQHGTFFYHTHMPMQEMMGMIGFFIIHPRESYSPAVDRDFGILLQEWAILPNNTVPNSLSMEFNWLTLNGKAGPATTPMLVRLGERVRIRFVNLGMDHHPMHLHGNTFWVTGNEGARIPRPAWQPGNTVLVGVAQARDIEFDARFPGDWMVHCHLPHHMMNQMVSMVGPMARAGRGMPTGMGMQEGMGILREGHATSEDKGPSLGRAIGTGSEFEKPVSNIIRPAKSSGMTHRPAAAKDPFTVPGYPQDMYMVMDEMAVKPETYGLRPGWTAGMQGMMTLVRVLEPGLYDKIQHLKKEQGRERQS